MHEVKPGKRELNRIRNRNAILDAARACFHDQGYDRVTIRDIIRRTGLAAGTFYNYFDDKEAIFRSLVTDFVESLNERLRRVRQQADNEQSFVYHTYLALFESSARDPVIYELAHRNEHNISEIFGADLTGLTMNTLREDLSAAVDRGLFPNVDQQYLAAAFFGVACELATRVACRARESGQHRMEVAREAASFATALFLGGVQRLQLRHETEDLAVDQRN